MKALGYLLIAAVALSVLKVAVTALLLAIMVLMLWGVLFRPVQMIGFAGCLLLWWLLANHPFVGWSLVAIGLLPLQPTAPGNETARKPRPSQRHIS